MRRATTLCASAFLGLALHAQTVALDVVATGFNDPTDMAHCGDSRLFVVQRNGRVKILRPDGQVLTTPFLDLLGLVNTTGGEQGLLGLAFHPQYAVNGWLYVFYCAGTGTGITRLSRFSVSANPDMADPTSELVLWELTQPYSNHKGGDLAFGPDGYLYFATGDGGSANDPGDRAQNMALGYGKLHRIDVDGGSPYAIPPTNPYATANNVDTLRTIYALGLRNPFRFGFDAGTGDLWIGDVGQWAKEEVDLIAAGDPGGLNFGWRCREGSITNADVSQTACGAASAYVEPVFDHDHADGWCAVIGGRVYRGARYPNLVGRYIYTDFCQGGIHSLHPDGVGGWISTALIAATPGAAALVEDALGELYVLNTENGAIYRIVDTSENVRLSPKLVLEGPYVSATGLMSDGMRTIGVVPYTEPYTTNLGYPRVSQGGAEVSTPAVFAVTGANAVVDWVRIELRPTSLPQMIAATAHGLLQRDGDVVAGDGSSPLTFHVAPGSYHVVVRHRNHLAAMTAAPIALTASTTVLDFRDAALLTYGTNARKTIGSTQALWAGNAWVDGMLSYVGANNDRDRILVRVGGSTPTATAICYCPEDVNLDGIARYVGLNNDRDPILVNIGGSVPTAVLLQQLP